MPKITLLASPTTAGANITGFAGGLSASTVYDVTVTRIRKAYGLEEAVSAVIAQNTGGGNDSISVILPTDTTFMYRLYIGSSAGTRYLVPTAASATTVAADDITGPTYEGGQTVYITQLPTSGDTGPVAPASGVTVHVTWVFGMEAYGCVELDKLNAYLTEDKATKDDPLNQRRMAGWKAFYKTLVLNHNYLRKIESGSFFTS
jgi:hypothetical protein